MRTLIPALLLGLMAATQAFAGDAQPSEDSVRRLMAATETRKVLDNALEMLDSSMDAGVRAALAGKTIDAKLQKLIDEMRVKMVAAFKEALDWKDMEPIYIETYQRSLTQDEVNAMIAFYESAAGKAVVRKLPVIMQNSARLMQERLKVVMPKILQIQQETIEEMKAAAEK